MASVLSHYHTRLLFQALMGLPNTLLNQSSHLSKILGKPGGMFGVQRILAVLADEAKRGQVSKCERARCASNRCVEAEDVDDLVGPQKYSGRLLHAWLAWHAWIRGRES